MRIPDDNDNGDNDGDDGDDDDDDVIIVDCLEEEQLWYG